MSSDTDRRNLARQWATIRLTGGFELVNVVRGVIPLVDSREAETALQSVCRLLDEGCNESAKWDAAAQEISALCNSHPDAEQESGSWYQGGPGTLALALTREVALIMASRSSHQYGDQVDFRIYRVFRYLLRAVAQAPTMAPHCLSWVDSVMNYCPPLAPEE